jgi:hypothetical protein
MPALVKAKWWVAPLWECVPEGEITHWDLCLSQKAGKGQSPSFYNWSPMITVLISFEGNASGDLITFHLAHLLLFIYLFIYLFWCYWGWNSGPLLAKRHSTTWTNLLNVSLPPNIATLKTKVLTHEPLGLQTLGTKPYANHSTKWIRNQSSLLP